MSQNDSSVTKIYKVTMQYSENYKIPDLLGDAGSTPTKIITKILQKVSLIF